MDVTLIISWLSEDDWFTDVQFTGDKDGVLFFSAVDEDGVNTELMFESDCDKVIVSSRTSTDSRWLILDILYPGQ